MGVVEEELVVEYIDIKASVIKVLKHFLTVKGGAYQNLDDIPSGIIKDVPNIRELFE